jgi:RNA polymerase sigma factor (sigma-70 family)
MLSAPPRPRRFIRADADERLVELVRAGQPAAFEELYDRYTPGLLSYCRHLLGSLDEAEDAVQHTFLAAHRALLADDREIHLKAWLYAIARNRCLSMLRARRERVGFDEEIDARASVAGLSVEVERREDVRALLGDLGRLPEDQRSALVLFELGAHTHDEIAAVLGVRREKVKALVFQARESLAATRAARETPCLEIREELAIARGGALRRGNLRRHLDACAGCRAFRDEVQHQRAGLAILLPVAPTIALKHAVLAGAAVTAGGGAAGVGAGTLGAAAGGAGAKATAAKLLTTVVVAGGAGGGGYVAINETTGGGAHEPTAVAQAGGRPIVSAEPAARPTAPATAEATPLPPTAATPRTPAAPRRHRAHRRAHQTHRTRPRPRVLFATYKPRPRPARHHDVHATNTVPPRAPRVHATAPAALSPSDRKPRPHSQTTFPGQGGGDDNQDQQDQQGQHGPQQGTEGDHHGELDSHPHVAMPEANGDG